jgi:YbgC/YbaW family acyl-CoA thioester hydrolase
MARIKISLPEQFNFSVTIPIRITDLNYGGHVGNDTILTLLHEARMQFLRHFGYSELEFESTSLIMSDAAIEFKSELFYGDIVKVYVTATDFSKAAFDICYELINEKNEKVVAVAKTGMVCFDYSTKKVTFVPEEAVKRLSN